MYLRQSNCFWLGKRNQPVLCTKIQHCKRLQQGLRSIGKQKKKGLQNISFARNPDRAAIAFVWATPREENNLLGVSRASPLPSMTMRVGSVGRWAS